MADEDMDEWAKTILDLMEAQCPVVERASAYLRVKVEREAKSGSSDLLLISENVAHRPWGERSAGTGTTTKGPRAARGGTAASATRETEGRGRGARGLSHFSRRAARHTLEV
jgi:hypothetical protein